LAIRSPIDRPIPRKKPLGGFDFNSKRILPALGIREYHQEIESKLLWGASDGLSPKLLKEKLRQQLTPSFNQLVACACVLHAKTELVGL
jgi:hypothetical protein